MRILGIDPGLTRCGVGVIDGQIGGSIQLVAIDVIRTAADTPLAERLAHIFCEFQAWIGDVDPAAVAVERVFTQHNLHTSMGTTQVSGLALVAAAQASVPVALHTPSEIKAAVTGSGRADKKQVGQMVQRLLRLNAPPKPADAADALAVAITHLWRGAATNRIAAAASKLSSTTATNRMHQQLRQQRQRPQARSEARQLRGSKGVQ